MGKLCDFVSPTSDKAYFFAEDRYIRYDIVNDRMYEGHPSHITGPRLGLFESHTEATPPRSDGSVYFFKGNRCAKYDWRAARVADGDPVAITQALPGVFESSTDAGVTRGLDRSRIYYPTVL